MSSLFPTTIKANEWLFPVYSADDAGRTPVILSNVVMHKTGNDALMALFVLKMMLGPTMAKGLTVVVKSRHTAGPRPESCGLGGQQ